jgi:hypothetical protein
MGGVVRPPRRQSEKPDFDLGNLKMINVSNKEKRYDFSVVGEAPPVRRSRRDCRRPARGGDVSSTVYVRQVMSLMTTGGDPQAR